jgi:transcriptional regulator with XRE-family HTH domain
MARPTKIRGDTQPIRMHYIPEWAARRDLSQADVARELEVDKSTVSRWFAGVIPAERHLLALVGLFAVDDVAALFRDPDDDWMARMFRGRSRQELERIIKTIETAFPRRGGEAAA